MCCIFQHIQIASNAQCNTFKITLQVFKHRHKYCFRQLIESNRNMEPGNCHPFQLFFEGPWIVWTPKKSLGGASTLKSLNHSFPRVALILSLKLGLTFRHYLLDFCKLWSTLKNIHWITFNRVIWEKFWYAVFGQANKLMSTKFWHICSQFSCHSLSFIPLLSS